MKRHMEGGREREPDDGRASGRAQSETIGVVILIAVTIIASVALVTAGSSVIDSSQRAADDAYVERALVQLDARAGEVALGESTMATAELGDTRGYRVDVREDAGRISIVHHGANAGDDEEIYNETLGAVQLSRDDTTLAYQAGGVWRSDGEGSVMVSPPSFTYRNQTLTFPVIRVEGSDSAKGSIRAVVRDSEYRTVPVFPNESASYEDGLPYQNTLQYGYVTVTVEGEYYEGWASYWREHATGRVSVDHANQRAQLDLYAYGTLGAFEMPAEGEPVEIRGYVGRDSLENFTVYLAPDDTDAAKFDNLQWSMYAEEGDKRFEVHLRMDGRADDEGACKLQDVSATVYYSETGGDTYEGWHEEEAFTTECVDRDGDGDKDETQLSANLTSETLLEQSDLSNDDLTNFNPKGDEEISGEPGTYAAHCGDPACEEAPIGDLVGYYMSQFGMDFDLVIDDKDSDTVNENASSGYIEYPGEGRITYLHVTENNVTVELE